MDTKTRSWTKSIVWRVIGIVILGLITYFITNSWKEMTVITILFHSIRLVLYYAHERLWERISWGKIKHPLAGFPVNKEIEPDDARIIAEQLRALGYLD